MATEPGAPEAQAGADSEEPTRPAVRFTLDWIEITDSMDLDTVGEFRFRFRVESDRRGLLRESVLPEEGVLTISEDADRNHVGPLDRVLYDGPVLAGESLVLYAEGEEVDRMSANDPLEPYERAFTGDPAEWVGVYSPWDQAGDDPERRSQWRLSYRVDTPVPSGADVPDAGTRTGSGR